MRLGLDVPISGAVVTFHNPGNPLQHQTNKKYLAFPPALSGSSDLLNPDRATSRQAQVVLKAFLPFSKIIISYFQVFPTLAISGTRRVAKLRNFEL